MRMLLAVLAVVMAQPVPAAAPPVLALTFDDLPAHGPWPAVESATSVNAALLHALAEGGIRHATGFVNAQRVSADPALATILQGWTAAGLPLANHGWSHRVLSDLSPAAFEAELTANEPYLPGARLFRFPYLDEGRDPALRDAARQILARHGYAIAPVDIDTADWAYNLAYVRCRAAGDAAAIARLEGAFLAQFRASATWARATAAERHGRDIPYVALLHVSAFTARLLPRLIALSREMGFREATLAEALADPVNAASADPRLPFESATLSTRAGRAAPQSALALDSICLPARTPAGNLP
jgi:peptidoglycan/xylan/chitin deacetylase (PgdA/CDA1 family)